MPATAAQAAGPSAESLGCELTPPFGEAFDQLWWMDLGGPRSGRTVSPVRFAIASRVKIAGTKPAWADPDGETAGIIEQNAEMQPIVAEESGAPLSRGGQMGQSTA